MTVAEDLLKIVQEEDTVGLRNFIKENAGPPKLLEIVTSLSRAHQDDLWEGLYKLTTAALLSLDGDEEDIQQESEAVFGLLGCVVSLAMAAICPKEAYICPSLLETAIFLHGTLLSLPEEQQKLQNSLSKLFEHWWSSELEGRNEVGVNTMIYLLDRSIQPKIVEADLKRVYSMRGVLQAVNLTDASCTKLMELLKQSFITPGYIISEQGQRFLSFVLRLNTDLITVWHDIIKKNIINCSRGFQKKYGEIYFKAWRLATDSCQERLATDCVQDLMYSAVHSGQMLFPALCAVLDAFHAEKKQAKVAALLVNLYDPILWRSMKVANPHVRSNAATLLIKAFPLEKPDSNAQEADYLLQKQFDVLQGFLSDPYPMLRAVGAAGLCHVLSLYWEMIPQATIISIVTLLFQDLAWDGSSVDVRVAVFKGLCELLDNHLTHSLLKPLLPHLRNCIHDVSERVRIAVVDCLVKIKTIRTMKVLTIVPMDHLLARLEDDTPSVCRRIVDLIFNSYLPLERSREDQLKRCLMLIQRSHRAARQLFQHAHRFMSMQEAVTYIILICRYLMKAIKKKNERENGTLSTDDIDGTTNSQGSDEGLDPLQSAAEDPDVVARLLEVITILWSSIAKSLNEPIYADIKKDLCQKLGVALPEFLKNCQNSASYDALMLLAGHLPAKCIPTLSHSCLYRLKHMTSSGEEDRIALLDAVMKWGKADDVLEIIGNWLRTAFDNEGFMRDNHSPDTTGPAHKRKRVAVVKSVKFVEPTDPEPRLAVDFLTALLCHPVCDKLLMEKHRTSMVEITNTLVSVMGCIEMRFSDPRIVLPHLDDDILHAAFVTFCKLIIKLNATLDVQNSDDSPAILQFSDVVLWVKNEVLPVLKEVESQESTSRQSACQNHECRQLAIKLSQSLLNTACNILMIGQGSLDTIHMVLDLCSSCLEAQTDWALEFFPKMINCLYHVAEYLVYNVSTDVDVSDILSRLAEIFNTVISSIAGYNRNTQRLENTISQLRSPASDFLSSVFRNDLFECIRHDVLTSSVNTIAEELTTASQENGLEDDSTQTQFPPVTRCIVGILMKRIRVTEMCLQDAGAWLKLTESQDMHAIHGMVQLSRTIQKKYKRCPGLKELITIMQERLSSAHLDIDGTVDESPERHMMESLLKQVDDLSKLIQA